MCSRDLDYIIILQIMELEIYFHIRSEKFREILGLHNFAQHPRYLLHCCGCCSHNSAACLSLSALYPLRLRKQHFPDSPELYFSLFALILSLSCCYSHGLALPNSAKCHYRFFFLPTFFPSCLLSLVAVFDLH